LKIWIGQEESYTSILSISTLNLSWKLSNIKRWQRFISIHPVGENRAVNSVSQVISKGYSRIVFFVYGITKKPEYLS